jgi:hypothetical protein
MGDAEASMHAGSPVTSRCGPRGQTPQTQSAQGSTAPQRRRARSQMRTL